MRSIDRPTTTTRPPRSRVQKARGASPRNERKRQEPTPDQVGRMLARSGSDRNWSGSLEHLCLNRLAAETGMSVSQLQGLPRKHVHLGPRPTLVVAQSWDRQKGLVSTSRVEVPLSAPVARLLATIMSNSPYKSRQALVFYADVTRRLRHGLKADAGMTPIDRGWIRKANRRAWEQIGVDAKSRGITFETWRYLWERKQESGRRARQR